MVNIVNSLRQKMPKGFNRVAIVVLVVLLILIIAVASWWFSGALKMGRKNTGPASIYPPLGQYDQWQVGEQQKAQADPKYEDLDGDGLAAMQEKTFRTDPTKYDTDGDGLSDREEIYVFKTVPINPDSDFDGSNDYVEIKNGTNPLKKEEPKK